MQEEGASEAIGLRWKMMLFCRDEDRVCPTTGITAGLQLYPKPGDHELGNLRYLVRYVDTVP